jgi:hypothetical protein
MVPQTPENAYLFEAILPEDDGFLNAKNARI